MIVFTDNTRFADEFLPPETAWKKTEFIYLNDKELAVAKTLFERSELYTTKIDANFWEYLFICEYAPGSQYDDLIYLSSENKNLPDSALCLAGTGRDFHGFKKREWISLTGNIHLSALITPNKEFENFGVGFLLLAAVSALEAIDKIDPLKNRAMIKWVNDIFIDKSKICGVLANAQIQGSKVTNAILGIGMNVESMPIVELTPFVPSVGCLRNYVLDKRICNKRVVFENLINQLSQNYTKLLTGRLDELIELYRSRSMAIGKHVKIWSETHDGGNEVLHRGIVENIGNSLELYLEGEDNPVTSGRLELIDY